ncbi:MAG: aminotransferase class I/II-fold pyridoxal phosphate-dependent enzyme [Planctomycetes bacterium]|nr:aminotransferase class I/II-fold pyridoxal phosphate-dependent enzyme [Planctomycetota bacterium]
MAMGLVGSEILKIAGQVRALIAGGREVCNLTVGDFAPKQFPIPQFLADETHKALERGETNYPPSDGMPELRKAVQRVYRERLGIAYPLDSILIASGARPCIYATYRAIVDPGETVCYPVPSWNNNHYAHLVGAKAIEIPVGPDTNFLPTASMLKNALKDARLLALSTPVNPTGTVMNESEVRALGEFLVEENARREKSGRRPLYLMYDQVYRDLTFRGFRHETPVRLVPECAPYVIFVDAISKSFCATGLRVGWIVGPAAIVSRMRDVVGHVGAWAPRAEQVASAKLLENFEIADAFHTKMLEQVSLRLEASYQGIEKLRARGVPVEAVPPQGAIYLTIRFNLIGKPVPGSAGVFKTNEEIREFLLDKAGFALVPFQAFGVREDSGWFRLSVGAVSLAEIQAAFGRLEKAFGG